MFNKDELKELKFDPSKVQRKLLEQIDLGTDYDVSLVDPSNSFIMNMEAITVLTANSLEEMVNNTCRIYPSMSRSVDDLYHHMTNDQEKNIFSTPAEAYVRFMINESDLIDRGVVNDDGNKFKVIIPKNTTIRVSDVIFTLLNDIEIQLIKNVNGTNKSFVEQRISDNDNALNSLGNLNSVITNDSEGINWIIFDTKVKQISRINTKDLIIAGTSFEKTVPLTDKYYFSIVYIKDEVGNWVEINKTYSDIVLNHEEVTVRVNVFENSVKFTIPSVYLISGMVSGDVMIDVFQTKGKILMPLDKYGIEEFKIQYADKLNVVGGDIKDYEAAAAIRNVNSLVLSKDILDGGVNTRNHRDVRKKIIHNTTGNIDLPITEHQLSEKARLFGFTLFKALDTVTERIFISGKNVNDENTFNKLPINMDIFNNQTKIIINDLDDAYDKINKYGDEVLIKSNTIFESINGITKIVNASEADLLANGTNVQVRNKLYESNYLFTPFYYILDKTLNILNSRIYDLDRPLMDKMVIINKNSNVSNININAGQYRVDKVDNGYEVFIASLRTDDYTGNGEIAAQISMQIPNTLQNIYFNSVSNINGVFKFILNTDFMVNNENFINILNGESNLATKFITLNIDATLIFYIKNDGNIPANGNYGPSNELYGLSSINNPVALCKQSFNLKLGDRLNYLWSNIDTGYTNRKFKHYLNDVPGVYDVDVYVRDPETGCTVIVNDDDNDGDCDSVTINCIHRTGDPIVDEHGHQIFKHRAGDTVVDENGAPIIDESSGIVRFTDILMIPYEFKGVRSKDYDSYIEDVVKLIKSWLIVEMCDLNKITLEHTKILYQAKKSYKDVVLVDGSVLNPIVTPSVILYVDKDTYENSYGITELTSIVGKSLHKYLDKSVIELKNVKNEIMHKLGNTVLGIKISNLSNDDKDFYKLANSSNRLTIKKYINNAKDLVYDIKIKIEKI